MFDGLVDPKRTSESRRHLAQNDAGGRVGKMVPSPRDQVPQWFQVTFVLIVRWNIKRKKNEFTRTEVFRVGSKLDLVRMLAQQFLEARLKNREVTTAKIFNQGGVGIKSSHIEAFGRSGYGMDEAQMRESNESDHD
jgi:hypothetical protein